MKKIAFFCLIGLVFIFCYRFDLEIKASLQNRFFKSELVLPQRITLKWPYMTDTFFSYDHKKYCGEGTGFCGTIEILDESRFKMNWQVLPSEIYQKVAFDTFIRQEDIASNQTKSILPRFKGFLIKLNQQVQEVSLNKEGVAFDKNNHQLGQVSAFLTLLDSGQEKKALVLEREKQKSFFVLNKDVYEPIQREIKQNRFLLAMSSYKRPIFASGQILRLFNQSYQNFDVSLVLKGVDGDTTAHTLLKEWSPYMKQNRMFLSFEKNKRQFSNWLDTFRNLDISKYDYICKIDDDDWYAPTHFENLNLYLNLDSDIGYSATKNYYEVQDNIQTAYYTYNNNAWNGNTLCVTNKIAQKLLEYESLNDSELMTLMPHAIVDMDTYKKLKEDLLIETLFKDKIKTLYYHSVIPTVIYNRQYPSVTQKRKAYLPAF